MSQVEVNKCYQQFCQKEGVRELQTKNKLYYLCKEHYRQFKLRNKAMRI